MTVWSWTIIEITENDLILLMLPESKLEEVKMYLAC